MLFDRIDVMESIERQEDIIRHDRAKLIVEYVDESVGTDASLYSLFCSACKEYIISGVTKKGIFMVLDKAIQEHL